MPVILLDVNDSEMSDAKSLFLVREILPVSSTTTKKCGQNVMKESYPLIQPRSLREGFQEEVVFKSWRINAQAQGSGRQWSMSMYVGGSIRCYDG